MDIIAPVPCEVKESRWRALFSRCDDGGKPQQIMITRTLSFKKPLDITVLAWYDVRARSSSLSRADRTMPSAMERGLWRSIQLSCIAQLRCNHRHWREVPCLLDAPVAIASLSESDIYLKAG